MLSPATNPLALNRRQFFASSSLSLGAGAMAYLMGKTSPARALERDGIGGIDGIRRIAPKAKRVIFLFQSGGPSHLDLFDYKPHLANRFGEDLPDSVRGGQRLTGFTKNQKSLPVVPTMYPFRQFGKSGTWMNGECLPHLSTIADDLCVIRSMHTDAINHDPARTLIQTGHQLAGRPSMGTWVSYGLGSECRDLPAFMVLNSYGSCKRTPQPVAARLWGSGFLPSQYQGVKLQSVGDPVLYVSNPNGVDRAAQRRSLDSLAALNRMKAEEVGDPETSARIEQYEMAFRMQASVPELVDTSGEPEETFALYGEDARQRGTYAANCLLARRMAERGVRFIQLYHVGWDHHQNVPRDLPLMCGDIDKASAALVTDLKRRGLLEDTLVVFGGEFGRTVFSQGTPKPDAYGRDHHGRCFSMWLAGGGVKAGLTYGATDDFGYSVVENPVQIHDLQATILHQLGIDHTQLTYKFQGRDYRLTDIHGEVVRDILA
ncbi:MAG: DUF1501 domain-containing protein [Verrucomicrobiae bacterium]|nr:DUF1501 domain-containing protein [Verrucomicrobiae bacterium]